MDETRALFTQWRELQDDSTEDSTGSSISKYDNRPMDPREPLFSYIASCINNAINILCQSKAIAIMTDMVIKFKNANTGLTMPFATDADASTWVTEELLRQVRNEFLVVFVDFELDQRYLAGTRSEFWNNSFYHHGIYIRVQAYNMVELKKYAGYAGRYDVEPSIPKNDDQYRASMFCLQNIFLHEVGGHLLTAHLKLGSTLLTPTSLKPVFVDWDAKSREKFENNGESGFWLVDHLYGINLQVIKFDESPMHFFRKLGKGKEPKVECYTIPKETVEGVLAGKGECISFFSG